MTLVKHMACSVEPMFMLVRAMAPVWGVLRVGHATYTPVKPIEGYLYWPGKNGSTANSNVYSGARDSHAIGSALAGARREIRWPSPLAQDSGLTRLPSPLAQDSGLTRFNRRSAEAVWVKCIVRAIRVSTASWRSRFCRPIFLTTPKRGSASTARRARFLR